jgi:hypothetical protein
MTNKVSGGQLFMGLVYSLTQSAFIALGKLPDPFSGKIERDLDQASQTIDLLAALHEKTNGNLEPEEEKFLARTISDLRLNYVDEVNKARSEKKPEEEKKDAAPKKEEEPSPVKDEEKSKNEKAPSGKSNPGGNKKKSEPDTKKK